MPCWPSRTPSPPPPPSCERRAHCHCPAPCERRHAGLPLPVRLLCEAPALRPRLGPLACFWPPTHIHTHARTYVTWAPNKQLSPPRSPCAVPRRAEARAANADGPARYLGLVRQLLGLGLSALQEAPAKITNARSRLAQVGGACGGRGGRASNLRPRGVGRRARRVASTREPGGAAGGWLPVRTCAADKECLTPNSPLPPITFLASSLCHKPHFPRLAGGQAGSAGQHLQGRRGQGRQAEVRPPPPRTHRRARAHAFACAAPALRLAVARWRPLHMLWGWHPRRPTA
jgi:hypothetical protein